MLYIYIYTHIFCITLLYYEFLRSKSENYQRNDDSTVKKESDALRIFKLNKAYQVQIYSLANWLNASFTLQRKASVQPVALLFIYLLTLQIKKIKFFNL